MNTRIHLGALSVALLVLCGHGAAQGFNIGQKLSDKSAEAQQAVSKAAQAASLSPNTKSGAPGHEISACPTGVVLRNDDVSASYSRSFGPSFVGGRVSASGRSRGKSARIHALNRALVDASLEARASLDGRLFGRTERLAEARAAAHLKTGSWSADGYYQSGGYSPGSCVTSYSETYDRGNSVELLLAGKSVKTIRDRFESSIVRYERDAEIFEKSGSFTVFGVPISVSVSSDANVYVSLATDGQKDSQRNLAVPRLEMQGSVRTWANGSAEGGIDLLLVGVFLEFEIEVANTRAELDQGFHAENGARGSLVVRFIPISTFLKGCIKYWAPTWTNPFRRKKKCTTLWSWTASGWTLDRSFTGQSGPVVVQLAQ